MKNIFFYTKKILFILALSSLCCFAKEDNSTMQNKILWINQITEILTKVLTYNNKLVLTYEYEKLLDNTNFDNLPDNNTEVNKLVLDLINLLKDVSDNWKKKEEVQKEYQAVCDKIYRESAINVLKKGLKLPQVILTDWTQVVPMTLENDGVLNYYWQAQEAAKNNFNKNISVLEKETKDRIHDFRQKIWNKFREEIKSSKITDSNRISIADYKFLISTLKNSSTQEQYNVLSDDNLKHRFNSYPAFWFYLGRSALVTKNYAEAEMAFKKFHQIHRNIFRDDEILHECIIAEVSLLMLNIKNNQAKIKAKLTQLCKIIKPTDWKKRYFAASSYYLLAEYNKAEKLLKENLTILSNIYKESSSHKYVDIFGNKNVPLLELPHDSAMEMQRLLIAKIHEQKNEINLEKFIKQYDYHSTLSIYEQMSYLGSVPQSKISQKIKDLLSNVACEINFSIIDTYLTLKLPKEYFCSSPIPSIKVFSGKQEITCQKIKFKELKDNYITLTVSIDTNAQEISKEEKLSILLNHIYCPIKLVFSNTEIKNDVKNSLQDDKKNSNVLKRYWKKSLSFSKIKTKTYKFNFENLILKTQK